MKNVLITGGSRGIGAACVRAFAKAGYNVAFVYKSNHEAAEELSEGTGAVSICADISCEEGAAFAVSEAQKVLGGIDILVNNAGISLIKLFDMTTADEWKNIIDTNLSSAFYMSKFAVHDMIKNKFGRIINIGSMWGKTGASCEVAYSASKAGMRGFTMALAKELAPSSVTVNCVEPGVIDTEMNASLSNEVRAELAYETPMGRFGEPSEVAAFVLFLASDSASYITGQCIGVDGGMAV